MCRSVERHVSKRYPAVFAHTDSCANPEPSSCLIVTLVHKVFAGCCQPLLDSGPSRRYLCESFSTCLDPYPGCSCGAFTRFFPQNYGLPSSLTRSALSTIHTIATAEQPWLLHPNTSRFVTSPCSGYANRPIRATDGKRTCTSQDSQPCRLFLDRFLQIP